ncbi:MAG: sirohydrochlorin chelatase [Bryobacteraceae bacterium]
MTALAVFAHGSRVAGAGDAVHALAAQVAGAAGIALSTAAFLDPHHPTLPEAVAKLVARGATHIVVVPYLVMPGLHLKRDLPHLAARLESAHPGLEIRITPPLEGHPGLAAIVLDLARGALAGWQ